MGSNTSQNWSALLENISLRNNLIKNLGKPQFDNFRLFNIFQYICVLAQSLNFKMTCYYFFSNFDVKSLGMDTDKRVSLVAPSISFF